MHYSITNPQLIDELILSEYYYLDDDECYFFHVYTANKGYAFNKFNQLIGNLKKSNNRKGEKDWKFKEAAIEKVANILRETFQNIKTPVTIIPIPPSACKEDEMYDDRMLLAAKKAAFGLPNINVLDVINLKENRAASHNIANKSRLNPIQLINKLTLDINQPIKTEKVILIDDVITTGSQFKACKNLILENYDNVSVIGLFIARTQHDTSISDFDDD